MTRRTLCEHSIARETERNNICVRLQKAAPCEFLPHNKATTIAMRTSFKRRQMTHKRSGSGGVTRGIYSNATFYLRFMLSLTAYRPTPHFNMQINLTDYFALFFAYTFGSCRLLCGAGMRPLFNVRVSWLFAERRCATTTATVLQCAGKCENNIVNEKIASGNFEIIQSSRSEVINNTRRKERERAIEKEKVEKPDRLCRSTLVERCRALWIKEAKLWQPAQHQHGNCWQ